MNLLKLLVAVCGCLIFTFPMQAQNVGRDKTVKASSYSVTKIKKVKTTYAPAEKKCEQTCQQSDTITKGIDASTEKNVNTHQQPNTNTRSIDAPTEKKYANTIPTTAKRIYAPVEKRWENTLNLLYYSFADYSYYSYFGLQYEGMYRMGKAPSLGFGLGYSCNFPYESHFQAYLKLKLFLASERRANLFFGFEQGVDVSFTKYRQFFNQLGRFITTCEILGLGSHSRIEIGLNIRLTPKSSMYISGGIGASPVFGWNYSFFPFHFDNSAYFRHYLTFGVNLGFTF